jgi:hypothetical protein
MTTIKNASIGLGAAIVLTLGTRPTQLRPSCSSCRSKIVGSRAVANRRHQWHARRRLAVDTGAFFSVLPDSSGDQTQSEPASTPRNSHRGHHGPVEFVSDGRQACSCSRARMPECSSSSAVTSPAPGRWGLMGRKFPLDHRHRITTLANGGVIRFSFPNDNCAKSNMAYWAGASQRHGAWARA